MAELKTIAFEKRVRESELEYWRATHASRENVYWAELEMLASRKLMDLLREGANHAVRMTRLREPWENVGGVPFGLRLRVTIEAYPLES